jgi:molybdopterin-guanine dinucleotide biosynthesis protein A
MKAVVLAGGGSDSADPLYGLSKGLPKALLPIAGKPLLQWVVDALASAKAVDTLVIVGLGTGCGIHFPDGTVFVPDAGSLLGNVRAGSLAATEGADPSTTVMVVSSDIPAIRPVMVDWLAAQVTGSQDDLYYLTVDRAAMDARYPGSGRSFIKFRDREICGGDITILRPAAFLDGGSVWKRLTEGRKSAAALAKAVGIDVLLLFLLRRLTVAETARKACARLRIRGRVIECPYPELGMDVDKPFQFDMVERDLLTRGGL